MLTAVKRCWETGFCTAVFKKWQLYFNANCVVIFFPSGLTLQQLLFSVFIATQGMNKLKKLECCPMVSPEALNTYDWKLQRSWV